MRHDIAEILLLVGVKHQSINQSIKSNLVRTTRFWNNLHQIHSKSKHWKDKWLKSFGSRNTSALNQIIYAWGRGTLVLIVITLYRTVNFNIKYIYKSCQCRSKWFTYKIISIMQNFSRINKNNHSFLICSRQIIYS